jgi:hypothetical protein
VLRTAPNSLAQWPAKGFDPLQLLLTSCCT